MKRIILPCLLALSALLSACNRSDPAASAPHGKGGAMTVMEDAAHAPAGRQLTMAQDAPEASPEALRQDEPVDKQRIIRDGRMGLRVEDLEQSRMWVDSLVGIHHGYYANERYFDSGQESSLHFSIRVPAAGFDGLILDLEGGPGQLLYKEVYARDVTEQFIDLESRLASKEAYLERYRELLAGAGNVKEVLEIEDRIRVLEEELDSTRGRLRYLRDRVGYATLELTISKEKAFRFVPEGQARFAERLKQALHRGWTGTIAVLLFLLSIWPAWILLLGAGFWWRRKAGLSRPGRK
jgi:hypothetical protein